MIDEDEECASTASELFALLEKSWTHIARHLTVSYSQRRKKLLLQDFESKLRAIEQNVQGHATANNSDEANHWRRADFFVRSIVHELEMWLAIHEDKAPAAWTAFCSAEGYAMRAAGWLPDCSLAQERVRHLAEVERVVFPNQPWFISSGLIVSKETCTLCGSEYGTCGHVAGEIYNGTVAWRRGEEIKEVLEVSFVKDPSDKNCRITGVNGGIDPLTGEPSPAIKGKTQLTPKGRRRKSRWKRRKR